MVQCSRITNARFVRPLFVALVVVILLAAVAPVGTTPMAQTTSACVLPPSGLVSWWPGDGSAQDIVGANESTPQNGADFAAGLVGQGFQLDGSDDFVSVPSDASLNFDRHQPMSVDAWVYRTNHNEPQHILGKRVGYDGGPCNYQLALHGGLYFGYCGAEDQGSGFKAGDVPLDQWTHVAATFDGSQYRIYINGTMVGESPPGQSLGAINASEFKIGTSGTGGTCYPFPGMIDEVELFDRALSDAEIQSIYAAGSAGKCKPENLAPITVDDAYGTTINTILNVAAPGVLANDTDPDGDPLTAVLVNYVLSGTLDLNPDGSFVYTPTTGFTGQDSFTYHAYDGQLDSNVGTVTITVTVPVCNVGDWDSIPDLLTARYEHQTILLPDGKVLVVGGTQAIAGSGDDLASTEIYDPATNSRTAGPIMSHARAAFSATQLPDGRVLVAGGEQLGIATTSAEIYDPSTNAWTDAADMQVPRHVHNATLLQNGKVLVTGGSSQAGSVPAYTSAEIYDPQTNEWVLVASMAVGRQSHAAAILNDGRVLVAGGNPNNWNYATTSTAEVYDLASNTWSSVPDMGFSRSGPTATLLQTGQVLVAGGLSSSPTALAVAELFDPVTDSWSVIADMSVPRYFHTATLLATGQVLIAGGATYPPFTSWASVEQFDPAAVAWSVLDPMEQDRTMHTATRLCNGKILFVGGWDGAAALGDIELYDPNPISPWTIMLPIVAKSSTR